MKLIKHKEVVIMTTKTYQLETVSCPSCIAKIEGMLKKTQGINESQVLFNSSRVKTTFDENVIDSETIKNKIGQLGYKVLSEK
jgi:copper chaperone CopZ